MSREIPTQTQLSPYGYCSQGTTSYEPIRSIEGGVELILTLLAKQVLCRHDVENINRIYREIDRLEHDCKKLPPESNSVQILNKVLDGAKQLSQEAIKEQNDILQKVNRLGAEFLRSVSWKMIVKYHQEAQSKESDYAASALISLYHLQRFVEVEKEMPIDQYFQRAHAQFTDRNRNQMQTLASLLPCCHYIDPSKKEKQPISTEQFSTDREALLGNLQDQKIEEILGRKSAKLDEYKHLEQGIAERKKKLKEMAVERSLHHMEKLLEYGYVHLFDHLMNVIEFGDDAAGQEAYINAMTFSEITHVVAETREAIIRCVEAAFLPETAHVLFLVGITGSGKSTTYCYLRGDKMIRKGDLFQSDEDPQLISQGDKSTTFFPNTTSVGDMLLIDFPGFADTNGLCVALGIELALKDLVKRYGAKILVLEELIAVRTGRAIAIDQLRVRMARLFRNSTQCVVGITKYSLENDYKEIVHQRETIRREEERLVEEQRQLNAEEERLQKDTKALEDACKATNSGDLRGILSEQQQRLRELQAKKLDPSYSSNTTPLIERCKAIIAERESELKNTEESLLSRLRGFPDEHLSVMRFEDVSDPGAREAFLNQLRESPSIGVEENHRMEESHRAFLGRRFQEQLKPVLEEGANYDISNSSSEFQSLVLTTSLVNAFTLSSGPEIGRFLHLPEVNHELADGFDQDIVKSCSDKLIQKIILEVDLNAIEQLLNEGQRGARVAFSKIQRLRDQVQRLVDHVLLLKSDDQQGAQADAWNRLRARYLAGGVPRQTGAVTWIPNFIGFAIGYVAAYFNIQTDSDRFFDVLAEQLNKAEIAIVSLQQLRNIVQNRNHIAEFLQPLSLPHIALPNLVAFLRETITQIRDIYGAPQWDERVELLKSHCPSYGKKHQLQLTGAISTLLDGQMKSICIANIQGKPLSKGERSQLVNRLREKINARGYARANVLCGEETSSEILILVDKNYYPLMVFDVLIEILKLSPRLAQQVTQRQNNETASLVQLLELFTRKSIVIDSQASVQAIISRVESEIAKLARAVQLEVEKQQEAGIQLPIDFVLMQERDLTHLHELIGLKKQSSFGFFETVFSRPSQSMKALLTPLGELIDSTLVNEISTFASEFLQMKTDTPLFRALLAAVYLNKLPM